MEEMEKIDYLQSIEANLRNQTDFKTNEVIVENGYHMESEEVCVYDTRSDVMTIEVDSDNSLSDKLIAFFEESVRKNKALIESNPEKGLPLISSQFNEFIEKLKAKSY